MRHQMEDVQNFPRCKGTPQITEASAAYVVADDADAYRAPARKRPGDKEHAYRISSQQLQFLQTLRIVVCMYIIDIV